MSCAAVEENLASHTNRELHSSLTNPPGLFVMQDMDLLFFS